MKSKSNKAYTLIEVIIGIILAAASIASIALIVVVIHYIIKCW